MHRFTLKHRERKKFRSFLSTVLILSILCSATLVSAQAATNTVEPDVITEETVEPELSYETVHTVIFDMGIYGREVYEVGDGAYPPSVPRLPDLPQASVMGWYNEDGDLVIPGITPVYEDTKYTVRYKRSVSSMLNTVEHIAYINGYGNGMFKPNNNVTRAEAVKMFYTLLLYPEQGDPYFSDVNSSKWYYDPINTMNYLGIVGGYEDNKFYPQKNVTRAEFVKMAVSFTTISDTAENTFPDVKDGSWAEPYISTAAELGWIGGFEDGSFRPNEYITRAQAVTVINKMLGRTPDADIKEKTDIRNFYDVYSTNWAYGQIAEASTEHHYAQYNETETWTDYVPDENPVTSSRWVRDGDDKYFLDASTGKFARGTVTIDGVTYMLDPVTGKATSGFRMENGYRRYYKDGVLQNDISELGVVSGPYYIKVFKPSNYLIIFARDEKGNYNTPVKAMRVSCGYTTPTGTYYTPTRYRWLQMVGNTWAQWCTQIYGDYLFHSVPNWTKDNNDLEVEEYNHLGETRSLGCVRLNCRDAKWIFDNCGLGTKVTISGSETSGPLPKPGGIQIPSWHTWDPTDPTAYWRCQQKGCH